MSVFCNEDSWGAFRRLRTTDETISLLLGAVIEKAYALTIKH